MSKKKLVIIALIIGLEGCVTLPTIGQIQTECETKTKTFPDMAECLKQTITMEEETARSANLVTRMTNERIRAIRSAHSILKLYLLKAEQLSQQVQKHEISDVDARFELQKLYVDIQHQVSMESAAAAAANAAAKAAAAANKPRTTTCHDYGYGVTCTTD
jgi:hypothetical protein